MTTILALTLAAVALALAVLALARSFYIARRLEALEAKPASGNQCEIRESNTPPHAEPRSPAIGDFPTRQI